MSSNSAEVIIIDCSSSDDEEDSSVQQISIKHQPVEETKPKNLATNGFAGDGDTPDQSMVVDITTPVKQQQQQQQRPQDLPPHELLELRRKKIDSQLDLFERCQQRLGSIIHLMNPTQRQRWQSLSGANLSSLPQSTNTQSNQATREEPDSHVPSSSTSNPTADGSGSDRPPAWRRPPWFIDPPGGSSSGTSYARRAAPVDDDSVSWVAPARAPVRRTKTKYKRKRKTTTTTSARKRTSSASTSSTMRSIMRTISATSTPSYKPKASTSSADRKPKVSKLNSVLSRVKKEH